MNITIITDVLPWPLTSGGAQAQYNMIDLLRHVHNFTIICPESGNNTRKAKRMLEKLWPNVRILLYPYIYQLIHFPFLRDKAIRALKLLFMKQNERFMVERILKPYGVYFTHGYMKFINREISYSHADIVQVEFFPSLPVIDYLANTSKKIFIHHELRFVRNNRFLQSLYLTESEIKMKANVESKEKEYLNKYDAVITLSQQDKEILVSHGINTPLYVSPAAINTKLLRYSKWNGRISFIGGYAHIPNQEGVEWFAQKVLPFMGDAINNKVDIIGKGWPQIYSSKYGFLLKGFVSDLANAAANTILIVPILTGSGMRMKILEAAAMSIPFITTSVGVEGLAFVNNVDCIIADNPQDFAKGLKTLMCNSVIRKTLASHAHQVFMDKYSKKRLAETRNNIYKELKK